MDADGKKNTAPGKMVNDVEVDKIIISTRGSQMVKFDLNYKIN